MLINRNFALLWIGQAISIIGDAVFDTTLVLWIATRLAAGQSWAPLAVSGVLLAATVPILLAGPLAGVFVDRWDKRRTMLAMDALRTLLILGLLATTLLVHPPLAVQLGLIYTVVVLATTCAQFFAPARIVLIGDIVAEPSRAKASGLTQVTMSLSIIIGPPIAAALMFGAGVQWALLLNALSFAVSFVAVLAMRVPRAAAPAGVQQEAGMWREFGAGLRFVFGNSILRTLVISVMLVMLGGGALNALDIFFVTGNLHTAASLYGLLTAALGAGALGGALVATIFAARIQAARMFSYALLFAGVLVLLYARQTSFAPAAAILFLIGVPNAVLNVAVMPLVLHATPREFVGRAVALLGPLVNLASALSMALAGYLDSAVLRGFHATFLGMRWGPVDTIFTATGLLVLAGGLYATINLRGVRLATASSEETENAADVAPSADVEAPVLALPN